VPRLEQWETVGDTLRPKSLLPAVGLVVLVMLVCSGVYAWWQRRGHLAVTPETPMTAQASPVQQARPTPPPAQPAPQEAAAVPTQTAPAPPPTETSAERRAAETPATPEAQPAAMAAEPARTEAEGTLVRVELTADEPVWVSARGDGKYLFSATLDANQSRTVEANGMVELRLGNAGGINITLNGKPIGPIGPKGQVRIVQLTSGGFKIVAPPKPAADLF
jgi:cytoskeleton protein RodZ